MLMMKVRDYQKVDITRQLALTKSQD